MIVLVPRPRDPYSQLSASHQVPKPCFSQPTWAQKLQLWAHVGPKPCVCDPVASRCESVLNGALRQFPVQSLGSIQVLSSPFLACRACTLSVTAPFLSVQHLCAGVHFFECHFGYLFGTKVAPLGGQGVHFEGVLVPFSKCLFGTPGRNLSVGPKEHCSGFGT